MRKSGGSASFVFELETYWVKGHAAQAKARVTASLKPPNRRPTRASPISESTSKAIDAAWAAGRLSHLPLQPKSKYAGRYAS